MFSTVGRSSRPARARAGPLLLSVLLNAGSIGAFALLGAQEVGAVVEAEVAMERPYDLRVPDMAPPGGTPAAAKPKAARRAAAPATVAPATVAPPVAAPTPPVEAALAPAAPAPDAGAGDMTGGLDGGGGDGDGDGGGGGGGGDGDGLGGGGVRVVHWSEVAVKVRAPVRASDYPAAAQALNLPDTRCVVRIQIDEAGRPYDVVVKTCPAIFRAAADSVARRYRFYPLRDESGRAVKAGFDLTLNFARGD